eukprot:4132868-Pyramimonas_sp.AAC.1
MHKTTTLKKPAQYPGLLTQRSPRQASAASPSPTRSRATSRSPRRSRLDGREAARVNVTTRSDPLEQPPEDQRRRRDLAQRAPSGRQEVQWQHLGMYRKACSDGGRARYVGVRRRTQNLSSLRSGAQTHAE